MRLSIATTLYRSAEKIGDFHRRASEAAAKLTPDYEIIMVDDGSPDNSLELACDLVRRDHRVRVIELSRNFGHHKAMMTALDHSRGDLVFLIDSDLEEDPALLETFYDAMQANDADVVYGYQTARKGNAFERITGTFAYSVFNMLMDYPVPANHSTVRLMRRPYVDALTEHRERETVIGGLWALTGFRQMGLPIKKLLREKSSYSLLRRWRAFIDSVTSFSAFPLVAIFYLGVIISSLSVIVAIWILANKLLFGAQVGGWVSVMLSVWFLGGVLVFCIGVIGIYISKIFVETKARPYTIIRRIHQAGKAPAPTQLV